MASEPAPWCVKWCMDKGLEFGPKHEFANIFVSAGLVGLLFYKPHLMDAYKINLIPLLLAQFMLSCSNAMIHTVPFAFCYFPKTWYLAITGHISQIAYTFKPFFILHSLIRDPLIKRYANPGFIGSIVVPLILAVIPIADYILDLELFSDQMVAGSITCGCGLANLGIAGYLIWSGETSGSSFPMFTAVYECLFSIPETIKFVMILHYNDIEAYATMERIDDYAFFFTVLICCLVLCWQNRRKPGPGNGAKEEWNSFDNQNVFV